MSCAVVCGGITYSLPTAYRSYVSRGMSDVCDVNVCRSCVHACGDVQWIYRICSVVFCFDGVMNTRLICDALTICCSCVCCACRCCCIVVVSCFFSSVESVRTCICACTTRSNAARHDDTLRLFM